MNVEQKIIRYRFTAWQGWDVWRWFFPRRWQARWAAKKLVRKNTGPYHDWNFDVPLVVEMPDGPYRVLDQRGSVEPYKAVLPAMPMM